jgi:SGNH hydrolase-like domain, acetyltransferase AlgX
MKRLLLALLIGVGVLSVALAYERFVIEQSVGPSAVLALSIVGCVFGLLLATYLLHDTRYASLMANLWMAAISTTVSYFILDFVAGLFLIQPLSPALVPDYYRHHKLVPNSYSKLQQQDFSYVQRVNNLGLRGIDLPATKADGTLRIVMLGDSFTMGKGVEDDQTSSVLLERSLRKDTAACKNMTLEVLNGGVDSYAPVLSFIQLKMDIQPLQPDLVILNLDVSDLVQEAAYRQQAVFDATGEIVAVPLIRGKESLTDRIRDWTDRHLFLTRAALFYANKFLSYRDLAKDLEVRSVLTQADYEIVAHTLAQDSEPRDKQWQDIFDSILKMKRYCEAHGIEFVLSVYPWGHQVSDTEWVPGRYSFMPKDAVPSDNSINRIREFAAENHVGLSDAFAAFRSYHGGKALYFRHDTHWTPVGQELMAKVLEDYLASKYLTNWCR